jgi:hypothetical protein
LHTATDPDPDPEDKRRVADARSAFHRHDLALGIADLLLLGRFQLRDMPWFAVEEVVVIT